MSDCSYCNISSPFADATAGWVHDLILGSICPICVTRLESKTLYGGVITGPPVLELSRRFQDEMGRRAESLREQARDVCDQDFCHYHSQRTDSDTLYLVIPHNCAIAKTNDIEHAKAQQAANPGTVIVDVVFPSDSRRKKKLVASQP